MSDLQTISTNRDLVILSDIDQSSELPQRNWQAIIDLYNQNNSPFPISAIACSKIIEQVKEGLKPSSVFSEKGISYKNFLTRYNKDVASLEELLEKRDLTVEEYQMIQSLRQDPHFILGQDLQRVRSFQFNELQKELKDFSKVKPETFLTYMKEFHPEEFQEKQEKDGPEVIIQIGYGLLESI